MQHPHIPESAVFISPGEPIKKRGRPPLFGRAMTRPEHWAREREKGKAARALEREKRKAERLAARRAIDIRSLGLVPGPLTSQIKSPKSFVRGFIDRNFPEVPEISASCNQVLKQRGFVKHRKVHDLPVVSRLVGTAIDYRIRAYFNRDILHSEAVLRGLAFLESLLISRRGKMAKIRWRQEQVGKHLIESYEGFVANVSPERRRLGATEEELLSRYCVVFAYLDWIGRAPFQNSAIDLMLSWGRSEICEMLSFLPGQAVEDVAALSNRFFSANAALVTNSRKAIVGGTLAGSQDVQGADFDLIVDGCLIDVKCRLIPNIEANDIRQLIAYWLLDYKDKLRIRNVAICNVGHGFSQTFSSQRSAGDENFRNKAARAISNGSAPRPRPMLTAFHNG